MSVTEGESIKGLWQESTARPLEQAWEGGVGGGFETAEQRELGDWLMRGVRNHRCLWGQVRGIGQVRGTG